MTDSFQTPGYEDLELSTQIVIKEALRRGIKVEMIDRSTNLIRLQKGKHFEYVQEATKTTELLILQVSSSIIKRRVNIF